MAAPTEVTIQPIDVQRLLQRMAVYLLGSIYRRAFAFGQPAVGTRGGRAPGLSRDYALYKSASRSYKSDATRRAAETRRKRSGKPGPGPLVNVLGLRTRLGPRSDQPDQRLTDFTAKAMGVVGETDRSITLGFRGDRAQRVAARLERRNHFWAPSNEERAVLQRMAVEALGETLKSLRFNGKIRIAVRL